MGSNGNVNVCVEILFEDHITALLVCLVFLEIMLNSTADRDGLRAGWGLRDRDGLRVCSSAKGRLASMDLVPQGEDALRAEREIEGRSAVGRKI